MGEANFFYISLIYFGVVCVAAATDYKNGKIYNWLTVPAILFGLGWAGVHGLSAMGYALGGFALAAALFLPLFATGVMGGGDVKLMMALGTVLGPNKVLEVAGVSFAITAVASLVILAYKGRIRTFAAEVWKSFLSLVTPGLSFHLPRLDTETKAPFGISILFGYVIRMVF